MQITLITLLILIDFREQYLETFLIFVIFKNYLLHLSINVFSHRYRVMFNLQ